MHARFISSFYRIKNHWLELFYVSLLFSVVVEMEKSMLNPT